MKLLHGTSSSNAAHIMKSGLKPRRGVGNWYKKHQFPTNKQFVHLASNRDAYEFHALRTALIHNSYCTVLEAEVEEENLYPDENLFAVRERVIIYDRNMLAQYQQQALNSKNLWKESLERMQTVAHRGPIDISKLKIVEQYPIEKSIYYGFVKHYDNKTVDAFDLSLNAFLYSQQEGFWSDPKYKDFAISALEIIPISALEIIPLSLRNTEFKFKYKGEYVCQPILSS